jgi:hypothetical protein
MDRRYSKRMESYWTRQFRKAVRDLDHVNFDSWFDLWHTHIDWNSKGNRFLEQRRRAAALTYDAYQYALARAKARTEPIQVWAQFCENTGDNAVYVHTPNRNGTRFPYVFEDTVWGVAAPPELEHITLAPGFELGKMQFQSEVSYVLRECT